MSRIADSVGTRKQPDSAISTACSSVRKPPCSIERTPAADRVGETVSAIRVGRDPLALAAGLEDGDRDLLRRELRDQRLVVVGDEPAGGGKLDPVRSRAERRAHDVPHLLRAVDEMRRPARIDRRQRPLEAGPPRKASPWPPVWEMRTTEICNRGPGA